MLFEILLRRPRFFTDNIVRTLRYYMQVNILVWHFDLSSPTDHAEFYVH